MDINLIRETVLVLALASFVGIVAWAYAPRRRSRFEEAAACVFQDDEHDALSVAHARAARSPRLRDGD